MPEEGGDGRSRNASRNASRSELVEDSPSAPVPDDVKGLDDALVELDVADAPAGADGLLKRLKALPIYV